MFAPKPPWEHLGTTGYRVILRYSTPNPLDVPPRYGSFHQRSCTVRSFSYPLSRAPSSWDSGRRRVGSTWDGNSDQVRQSHSDKGEYPAPPESFAGSDGAQEAVRMVVEQAAYSHPEIPTEWAPDLALVEVVIEAPAAYLASDSPIYRTYHNRLSIYCRC